MAILILRPGLATTVQDLGRPGHREFGVPEAGACDRASLRLANALLGNDPGAAALELTMTGGTFEARQPLAMALAGAPFAARVVRALGIVPLEIPQSFAMDTRDRLILGGSSRGLRAYLAVRGGWRTDVVLGSRSSEARLVTGDAIPAEVGSVAARRPESADLPDPGDGPIRLIDGPDGAVPALLRGHAYRVGMASDRVGLRLDGPAIEGVEMPGRPSAPVAPGAVQVAGGRFLILGPAGGTMGGYPHVAHVISADLDRLGQARPGQEVRFVRIDWCEARRLDRERRAWLAARDRRIAAMARSAVVD